MTDDRIPEIWSEGVAPAEEHHWGVKKMQPTWNDRIPQAIEKAERHLTTGEHILNSCKHCRVSPITAGEVALAKALWKTYRALNSTEAGSGHWPDALRAFVEKVEQLTTS